MELPPPPDVVRAAYAELVVTDLAEARRFYVDLLGLVVSAESATALYLRGYDELIHHNLILRAGPEPAAARLAYRVRTAADLDLAEAFFAALGSRTSRVPAGVTPGVGEAVREEDPLGFTVEFFFAADGAERLQQRYDLRRGAEPARLDHFNITVSDVRAAYEYYTSLGFGLSETIEDGNTLYAAWMFRKQTVHDVAFTGGPGPRLHHVAFFVHESHQVLRICDILGSLHQESMIERGPGRHGVSNAFYVYLRDPDGHRVELYTSDYYTGDPDHPVLRWSVRDPRRRDFWGHAVVPSWYTEASTVLDLDDRPRPLQAEKQTAEVTVGADGFTRLPARLYLLDWQLARGLLGAEHLLVEFAHRGLRDLGHERPVLRYLPARHLAVQEAGELGGVGLGPGAQHHAGQRPLAPALVRDAVPGLRRCPPPRPRAAWPGRRPGSSPSCPSPG